MNPEIKTSKCDYCGDDVNPESSQHIAGYKLCDECLDAYDNKTGFCSLDCCISGNCDESC